MGLKNMPTLHAGMQVEQAKVAHLCTLMSQMHHRRAGFPFGTLVDFASDGSGFPIFCLSPLAIHTRNILEDSRCSLVHCSMHVTDFHACDMDFPSE